MTQRKTILVVDDREQNLILFNQVLRRFGYDVVLASSGGEGLAQARKHRPDLILLDLVMPEMDGYEAARQLREDPDTAAIPIVATTGSDLATLPRHPLDAGFRAVLPKPFQLSKLLGLVTQVLAGEQEEPLEPPQPLP